MKKIFLAVVILAVAVIGFFVFSVSYSKSKVDAFFNGEDGKIYASSGFVWKLTNATSGLFRATYTTELSVYGEDAATFEHKAEFGLRSLNIFKIGNIDTVIKIAEIPELEQFSGKEFKFASDVKFSGIDAKFVLNEGNKTVTDESYWGESEVYSFAWKNVKANYFFSFDKDVIDLAADIPYVSINKTTDYDTFSVVIENQKYSSKSSKKKVGFWLGDTTAKIGKITAKTGYANDDYFYEDENEDEDVVYPSVESNTNYTDSGAVVFSDIDISADVKTGSDSTLTSSTKISLKNLKVDNDGQSNISIDDLVFNLSLENLDLESFKKIYEAASSIDPKDEKQLMFVGMALIGYVPDILAKHPKVALNEFSFKHNGEPYKANGFAQYLGSGDLKTLYTTWTSDTTAKFDFSFGEKLVREFFKKEVESEFYWKYDDDEYDTDEKYQAKLKEDLDLKLESLKTLFDFKIENGKITGNVEFKDGKLLLNGKDFAPFF